MVACVSILIHLGKRNQSWLNYKGMGETEDQVKFTVVLFYGHKQKIASVIVISLRLMQHQEFHCSPCLLSVELGCSECGVNIKVVAVVLKGSLGLCCSQTQNMKRINRLPYLPLTPSDYSSDCQTSLPSPHHPHF